MTYRKIEIEGPDSYLKFENVGQVFEGVFLKTVEESASFGPQQVHYMRDAEGRTVGLYGNWDLNRKMFKVEPETMTRITYTGDVPTKKGSMREFLVEVDDAPAPKPKRNAAAQPDNDIPF